MAQQNDLQNLGLNAEAQQLIRRFQANHLNQDQYRNFRSVMAASPKLIDDFNLAAKLGIIKELTPVTGSNAGGSYSPDDNSLSIPLSRFDNANFGMKEMFNQIFVMAHETRHAFNNLPNNSEYEKVKAAFLAAAQKETSKPYPLRDNNTPLSEYIAFFRKDEAQAQVAGANAVISAMLNFNITPDAANFQKYLPNKTSGFFIDANRKLPVFKSGYYQSNSTNSYLDEGDPRVLETAAQNYYDLPPAGTGFEFCPSTGTKSDYVNAQIVYPLSMSVSYDLQAKEQVPSRQGEPFKLNMQDFAVRKIDGSGYVHFKLDAKLISENGLQIEYTLPNREKIDFINYLDTGSGQTGALKHDTCSRQQQQSQQPQQKHPFSVLSPEHNAALKKLLPPADAKAEQENAAPQKPQTAPSAKQEKEEDEPIPPSLDMDL
jgi:hypothetical protein